MTGLPLKRFNTTRAAINKSQLESMKAQGKAVPPALQAQVQSDKDSQSSWFSKLSQAAHSTASSLSTSVQSPLDYLSGTSHDNQILSREEAMAIVYSSPPIIGSRVINGSVFVVRATCDPLLGPQNNCLPPPGTLISAPLTAGRKNNTDGTISNCLPAIMLFVVNSKQLAGTFLPANGSATSVSAFALNDIGNLTHFIGDCPQKELAGMMLDSIAWGDGPMDEYLVKFEGDSNSTANYNIQGGPRLVASVNNNLVSTINSACGASSNPSGGAGIGSWWWMIGAGIVASATLVGWVIGKCIAARKEREVNAYSDAAGGESHDVAHSGQLQSPLAEMGAMPVMPTSGQGYQDFGRLTVVERPLGVGRKITSFVSDCWQKLKSRGEKVDGDNPPPGYGSMADANPLLDPPRKKSVSSNSIVQQDNEQHAAYAGAGSSGNVVSSYQHPEY